MGAPTSALQQKVDAFDYWYHKITLPGGIVTPGWAPVQTEAYRVPLDLTGLRVLDVGCWDGFWCFEALKRGAREVVGIDDFSDDVSEQKSRRATAWAQFDLCREALGYEEGQCRREEVSLYDLTPSTFGMFDVVFFFGTLYHCRYPLLALDRLSAVCEKSLYIESAVLDDFSVYQGGFGDTYANRHVVMEFYPDDQYAGVATNWWVPTIHCMVLMLKAAGFDQAWGWKLCEDPAENIILCRGFAHGEKA